MITKLSHPNQDCATELPSTLQQPAVFEPKPIRALIGLMFVPMLVVTWHHARDYWVPMRNLFEEQVYFKQFITLFFVLSGFTLASTFRSFERGAQWRFYAERIARVWPMHVLLLVVLLFALPDVFVIRGEWFPIFVSNLFLAHSWVPLGKWYWSYNAPSYLISAIICLELAFPFLIIGLQRYKIPLLSALAALVGVLIYACNIQHLPMDAANTTSLRGWLYISPLARLLEFSVGAAAALTLQNYAHRIRFPKVFATVLEILAIALLAFVNINSRPWQAAAAQFVGSGGAFWLHNSGFCLLPIALFVSLIATQRGLVSKFFASKPLLFLSEISLGFYMLHAVYIAYFNTRFYEEPQLLPALYFFASLFLAGHVIHTTVFDPLRMFVVRMTQRDAKSKQVDKASRGSKRISARTCILAGEAVLAILFFYLALPTIHPVTATELNALRMTSSVNDVEFQPWLLCKSAFADTGHNQISVKTFWQAEKNQSINFFITAKVLDDAGIVLGTARYAMDGRQQNVRAGEVWSSAVAVPISPGLHAKKVMISLTRGQRKSLAPSSQNSSDIEESAVVITDLR